MRSIRIILAGLLIASAQETRNTRALITTTQKKNKSSNKISNKKSKAKPNSQYKSSKPIRSKCTTQFRNKSNI